MCENPQTYSHTLIKTPADAYLTPYSKTSHKRSLPRETVFMDQIFLAEGSPFQYTGKWNISSFETDLWAMRWSSKRSCPIHSPGFPFKANITYLDMIFFSPVAEPCRFSSLPEWIHRTQCSRTGREPGPEDGASWSQPGMPSGRWRWEKHGQPWKSEIGKGEGWEQISNV